ncbi:hypothetical protein ACHQM5_006520 [Ranunculus cassubicifolius]
MSGYSCWSGDWDDKIYIGERSGISTKERPEMKWLWRITFIGFYNICQWVLHKLSDDSSHGVNLGDDDGTH